MDSMPFPMMKKDERETFERWKKSIENVVGLPSDLMVCPIQMSFYFQNRDKITIKQSGKEIYFFVCDNKLKKDIYKKVYGTKPVKSDRELVFDENALDRYFKIIDFRGAKTNASRFTLFMSSDGD